MNIYTPPWQIPAGFYKLDGDVRRIHTETTARLWQPLEAKHFSVMVKAGSTRTTLRIDLDNRALGEHTFSHPGVERVDFPLPEGSVAHEAVVSFHGDRLALVSFGFELPEPQ